MANDRRLSVRHELRKKQGRIRVRRFHREGSEHFAVRLYVEGDTGDLTAVTYELHPTFREPERTVSDPARGFALDIWTWGEFDVDVTFHSRDGTSSTTVYALKYSDELPAEESAYIDETDASIRGTA